MFKLKKPCPGCPFLKNSPTGLHPDRLPSIVEDLHNGDVFYCHKTIDYGKQFNEETDEFIKDVEKNQFCAGAMIYLEKQKAPNQIMQIAGRLGYYNNEEVIEHKERVIDSLEERSIL